MSFMVGWIVLMKENILKAVCKPPEIFKAPFTLFIGNFAGSMVCMILGITVEAAGIKLGSLSFLTWPVTWIGVMVIMHVVLMSMMSKDAHIANMIVANSQVKKITDNAIKHKGAKFSP
jgi:type IV secretory pathway VirB3-like protein